MPPMMEDSVPNLKVAILAGDFEAETVTMSIDSDKIVVRLQQKIPLGTRTVLKIDKIGMCDGIVNAQEGDATTIILHSSPRKRQILAEQIEVLARGDRRGHDRHAEIEHSLGKLSIEGHEIPALILNISQSGALFSIEAGVLAALKNSLGSQIVPGMTVRMGSIHSVVARVAENGVGVQFIRIQPREVLQGFPHAARHR